MLDDCPTFCSQIFFAAALGLIKRHLGCVATTSVPTLAAESLWHNCAHATVSLRVTRRKKKLLQFFPGLEVCKKANHRWCLDDKFNPFIYLRPKKRFSGTLFWLFIFGWTKSGIICEFRVWKCFNRKVSKPSQRADIASKAVRRQSTACRAISPINLSLAMVRRQKNAINNFMTRCWNVDKRVLHLKERFYDTFFCARIIGSIAAGVRLYVKLEIMRI